jgi:hypothetical protein
MWKLILIGSIKNQGQSQFYSFSQHVGSYELSSLPHIHVFVTFYMGQCRVEARKKAYEVTMSLLTEYCGGVKISRVNINNEEFL